MREYIVNESTEHQKCYSLRNRAAFYDQPVLSYGSYWVWNKKKYKCKKTLKKLFLKNISVHNLQKVSKSTVLNAMIYDKINLTKATSKNLST